MKHILIDIALSYLCVSFGVTFLFLGLMFFKEWRRSGNEKANELKVFGLTEECPAEHGNPTDCHLHAIREMSLRERCGLVSELGSADLIKILTLHEKCLARKKLKKAVPEMESAAEQI